jgi:holin-like protein
MLFFLTVILACQLAGEVFVAAAGLPVPGPVCGMVLLFAGLMLRGLPAGLAQVADSLLSHLSLLFVPAGVGVMLHAGLIGRDWLPISVALVASTVLTVVVTAAAMSWLGRGGNGDA